MIVETVFALLLIVDHEIKEHLIQPTLSQCLKASASRCGTKKLLIELYINALNLKPT